MLTKVQFRTDSVFGRNAGFVTEIPYGKVVRIVLAETKEWVDDGCKGGIDALARNVFMVIPAIPIWTDSDGGNEEPGPAGAHVNIDDRDNTVFFGLECEKRTWGHVGFGGELKHAEHFDGPVDKVHAAIDLFSD